MCKLLLWGQIADNVSSLPKEFLFHSMEIIEQELQDIVTETFGKI